MKHTSTGMWTGVFLLAAGACSDFAMAPDRTPTELRLTPDTVVLTEGDTVAFELTVLDQHGEPYEALPPWSPPFWESSNESVFRVDGAGVASALEPGEGDALVELAGLSTAALVRTNPMELGVSVEFAYLTQSVQRRSSDVPLVRGRDGLLRVYVRGAGPNYFRPTPEARFYRGGVLVHTQALELESPGLPEALDEGDALLSYDGLIPGSVLQPGTSVEIDVDPAGVVPASVGSQLRYPEAGRLALDVRDVPPFRMRLVPVHQSYNGISSTLSSNSMNRTLQLTADIFPMGEFDLDLRARYTTAAQLSVDDGWYQLIVEIAQLRLDDGSARYYYGGFERPGGTRILGLGYVGYPVAIGDDALPGTIAHEVGHNLGLPHAPCGGPANADPRYPYLNASTGVYGYDPTAEQVMDPEFNYDLMSYCDPIWISDYNFERVIEYRDTSSYDAAFETGPASRAVPEDVLILSGGVWNGQLRLSPALASRAPAHFPKSGAYTLEGRAADGTVVFSLPVQPRTLDHGGSLFTAAIPTSLADPARVAVLRLTGPEGVVERARTAGPGSSPARVVVERDPSAVFGEGRWDTATYPLAVVRDRATGRIVAMARHGRVALPAGDVEVFLSDGIATHPARIVDR